MSVHVSSAVWKMKGLPIPSKLILLKLADNANDSWEAWPSVETITEQTGMDRRTVFRHLSKLEGMGIIKRRKIGSNGSHDSTRYLLVQSNIDRWQRATGGSVPRVAESHPTGGSVPLEPVAACHPNHQATVIQPSIPPNPQGGAQRGGGFIPIPDEEPPDDLFDKTPTRRNQHRNGKRLSEAEKQRIMVDANSLMVRVGSFFGRKPTTKWTLAEKERLEAINPPDEDIELLEEYYLAVLPETSDFRVHALITLINNWNKELDRARVWKASQSRPAPKPQLMPR